MTRTLLRLGFSPCPNDTFMFHALVSGRVVVPGVEFAPQLADIEELNQRATGPAPFAVTKLSVGALAGLADRYTVLSAGAALGHGVGPLVVARADAEIGGLAGLAGRRVATPGARTTATLLLGLFGPRNCEQVEMRFDRILAAVAAGDVDAGVIIHESRFTYAEHGLVAVADLGGIWESDTGLPLPLGVIAAIRQLPSRDIDAIESAVRASVQHAQLAPEDSRAYVRSHAQELSDDVCARHIALYVNAWSRDLGDVGRQAIDTLLDRGRRAGLLDGDASPWR